ncbi:hypothetical protein FHR34_001227 [Kitasatospora kifunensis]|uniref:Uncharacterized protein n=1 Tax=Kitasatospora kifunensis TaxID=58351 RepID=A0A7W7QZ83_KITKI|nr:hypothetical protein [Kitasatospora kifunensis]
MLAALLILIIISTGAMWLYHCHGRTFERNPKDSQ